MVNFQISTAITGTSTNMEGLDFFLKLDNYFQSGQKIRLDLLDGTPFSTSFLNSSFGALIDKYGWDVFRNQVVFFRATNSQKQQLTRYFEQMGVIA